MTVATGFWFVRHAPVIDPDGKNPAGKAYGHLDVSADVADRAWISRVAALLPQKALWITSQLKRTRDTAHALIEAMAEDPRPPVSADPDLAEQHFGHWQGLGHEAIASWCDADAERFWASPADSPPPGGESFSDQVRRTRRALDRLVAEHLGRDMVLVVHGGTVRAALAHAMDMAPKQALAFEVDNLSITHMRHLSPGAGEARFVAARGPWRVEVVNRSLRHG